MTRKTCLFAALWFAAPTGAGAGFQPADLKIVVIAGEGAVNVIQRKTAVAPIVEVRDRNNLPVSGATVTFTIGGGGAQFGGGGALLTATTNAAGQATAAGLTPTAAGAVQINVTAAFQGQAATAAITQTNFATAAQAAAAGSSAGGGGSSSGAAGGATGAGAGGGGISATTIAIVGGAVAGGAVVATQTNIFGDDGFVIIRGQVFATVRFGGECTVPPGVGQTPIDCYGPPVSGAVVSTTLDSATATTDGAGNFDLTTTIPGSEIDECKSYTLTITATAQPTYSAPVTGFAGDSSNRQRFSMSPPTPMSMGGGGC